MIRRLFKAASALSLLMFVATVVLWILSYFHEADFVSTWMSRRLNCLVAIASDDGVVALNVEVPGDGLGPMRQLAGWSHLGVFVNHLQQGSVTIYVTEFHYWDLFVIFLLIPTGSLIATRARRCQPGGGACRSCGYDLRASNDRCPECGTPIPQKAGATA